MSLRALGETAGFVPTLEFPLDDMRLTARAWAQPHLRNPLTKHALLGASEDPSAFIHPTAPKTKPTMRWVLVFGGDGGI